MASITRKFLSSLEIEGEAADKVIERYLEKVDELTAEIAQYKEDAEKLPAVQKELDDLKNSKDAGDSEYKEKYEKEHQAFEEYKAAADKKEKQAAKEQAYRQLLKDASLNEKGIEKALKYANWDDINLDDKGKIADASKHIKAEREEWSEYIEKTSSKGAQTATPPVNNGGGTMTRKEIMAIKDTTARQRAIQAHPEAFRVTNKV